MTAPALVRLLAALLLGLGAVVPAAAQTVWRMPTEYPATAMPGEGIAVFAVAVANRAGGRLTIEPSYDARLGIRSADLPKAVGDGTVEAGDAFASALAGLDPIFGLAALPFVTPTVADARRLVDRARPLYERALAAKGLRLLYTTPWPPSGLWLKQPLTSVETLRHLSVRTYDATSTAVLTRVGAQAFNISFADAEARIRDGTVNAVLSSGDGGAGRRLWELLPHFAEINYVVPLSFAVVSRKAYDGLDPDLRDVVDRAAAETEERQWGAIRMRLEENYRRMRENGVTIQTAVDPSVTVALKDAARDAVTEWRRKAGPEADAVLDEIAR